MTAAKPKLGKRESDALACPPGRRDRIVFDGELPGFGVRVTRDGTKTFLFQYRRGATVRRLRLGRYGELTPAQARRLAEEMRGQVAAGRDPVADRAAAAAAETQAERDHKRRKQADALTVRRLIEMWTVKQLAHRAASYRREGPRALRHALTALLDSPAASIDVAAAQAAIDAIPRLRPARTAGRAGRTGRGKEQASPPAVRGEAMARRVRVYGSALYGWAMKRGLVAANPFAAAQVESRDLPRERVLTDAELGEVWRAAGALGPPWDSFMRLLLLTLQRRDELAGVTWPELSADFATWELPGARTKNGRPHTVHLAEPARDILRSLPRRAGTPLVFTTTGRTPLSGFARAKSRMDSLIARERAERAAERGCAAEPMLPWRLHDFRRTGVTVLARKGVRWEVADKLLNHVQGAIRGVAAVYQRHEFLTERAGALDAWAAHVLAVAAGAIAADNIVEFRRP